jgi:ClpP class serine protease
MSKKRKTKKEKNNNKSFVNVVQQQQKIQVEASSQPQLQIKTMPLIKLVMNEAVKAGNYDFSIKRCEKIIEEIENITKRRTISYFATQIDNPAALINDSDSIQIEDMLRLSNVYDGLDLILNSSGGYALSAERIINVCKTYITKNRLKEFRVIVPRAAKSAATMVALGADKTLLCDNAELGPIDPQLVLVGNTGIPFTKPAFLIRQALDELLMKSGSDDVSQNEKYKIFLSQYNYDIYTTAKNELELSLDIAQKIFNSKKGKFIKLTMEAFDIFTNPKKTLAHGRLIGIDDLENNALYANKIIEDMRIHFAEDEKDKKSDQEIKQLSSLYWELYIRNTLLLNDAGNAIIKTIQTKEFIFPSFNTDWKPLTQSPKSPPQQP